MKNNPNTGNGNSTENNEPKLSSEKIPAHELLDSLILPKNTKDKIVKYADSDIPVFLIGETGSGKSQAAKIIHSLSNRSDKPFEIIDSSMATSLAEATLFGHESGAYTGAHKSRKGLLEVADGGTIVFENLQNLDKDIQTKLLWVLDNQMFKCVGSQSWQEFDIRFISTVSRDPKILVKEGQLLPDLLNRLLVGKIYFPEIPPKLKKKAILQALSEIGGPDISISEEALEILCQLDFKGVFREVRNVIKNLLVLSGGNPIDANTAAEAYRDSFSAVLGISKTPNFIPTTGITSEPSFDPQNLLNVVEFNKITKYYQKKMITNALRVAQGNISEASRIIGWDRKHLRNKAIELGIDINDFMTITVTTDTNTEEDEYPILKYKTPLEKKEIIIKALERNNGNILATARELGYERSYVFRLIKQLGIKVERPR